MTDSHAAADLRIKQVEQFGFGNVTVRIQDHKIIRIETTLTEEPK